MPAETWEMNLRADLADAEAKRDHYREALERISGVYPDTPCEAVTIARAALLQREDA